LQLAAVALVCGATLTACGSGGDSKAAGDAPSAAASKSGAALRPVHDPPAKFATTGARMPDGLITDVLSLDGTLVGPPPVTLYGSTAYVGAFDHVQAIDTANGHVTATIEPKGNGMAATAGIEHKAGAPAVVRTGGTPALVTPFPVVQTGTGTQADHVAVEVAVSDPATAKERWRVTLRLPEWAAEPTAELTTTAVGADGNIAVVTVTEEDFYAVTFGVDLTAHRQVWAQEAFAATGIAKGTAVGWSVDKADWHIAGHDAATGKRRWQGQSIGTHQTVSTAGPNFVQLQAGDWGSDTKYLQLLDPATGTTKQRLPAALGQGTCVYDEKSTLVCHDGTSKDTDGLVAYGLDATTGKMLWQLPDKQADRVAPEITTAWHGRVYGKTEKGPVALDARTGEDIPTSPGIAPVLVNGSAGLALKKEDWRTVLFVYPATG
jgi:hypothetical protein